MSPSIQHRRPRRAIAAIIACLGLVLAGLSTGQVAASPAPADSNAADSHRSDGPDELPLFRSTGQIVDPLDESLPWNPTKEFIFPSVFHAGKHLDDPLAEWYIYYAPHDRPGGINLMYADSLKGPWKQYEGNPLITNKWDGIYDVSHISSPDTVWSQRDGKMYLFFHGENTVTRFATSKDGLDFKYGDEVITADAVDEAQHDFEFPADDTVPAPGRATETSYARVFRHPGPSTGYRWGMFFMTNYKQDDSRRISVAYSKDLRNWDIAPKPIIEPGKAEGTNVSAADLWRSNGQNYILYHGTTGTILARPVNRALTESGTPEKLFVPEAAPPDAGRAASPQLVHENGKLHMFYEYGERSHTTIGHAVEDPDAVRDPLNQNPEDPLYESCPGAGSDQFEGDTLDDSLWSGSVRLDGSGVTVADNGLHMPTVTGNSTSAPQVLQPVRDGAFEVTTELTIKPEQKYQQGGLIVRRDDANSLRAMLEQSSKGPRIDFIWRRNGVDRIDTHTSEDYVYAPDELGDKIWLRITSTGEHLTASYSIDGKEFLTVGRSVPVAELLPETVGTVAYRGPESAPEIDAAFDWVRFTPTDEEAAACG
ncbi:DUF1349 domain-containing protein [Nocardioidaceae bacterium SCSIO 66511]|nr:DUF1349 domain-containing protein [Nocardioidaceae bacterium SCSIO 66511]